MTITKNQEGEKLTIALQGRLDTVTSPELESELKTALDGAKELIMDFTKLEYISSAGLRVLLSAHKKMDGKGGKMKLTNINEMVREVLDVTGFMNVLNVE
ncbi:STAS domain-containing protein [Treponema sp. C6A8]|uniref:STAS domain-containing protein n=1 Tax=Treponema sp. C6A8 TaxID=1410609 RepID=UPI00048285A0|nr:STAS domain-containing protein [Treponema sp. C6A8]